MHLEIPSVFSMDTSTIFFVKMHLDTHLQGYISDMTKELPDRWELEDQVLEKGISVQMFETSKR